MRSLLAYAEALILENGGLPRFRETRTGTLLSGVTTQNHRHDFGIGQVCFLLRRWNQIYSILTHQCTVTPVNWHIPSLRLALERWHFEWRCHLPRNIVPIVEQQKDVANIRIEAAITTARESSSHKPRSTVLSTKLSRWRFIYGRLCHVKHIFL